MGLSAVRLHAQQPAREPESFLNQQRAVDEEIREALESEREAAWRGLFDWGGWYSAYVFVFDDGVESSRTLRRHDTRLWGRLRLDGGIHEFYARARLSLLDFNSGDAYDGNDDDIEGPNLERGYYRLRLSEALRRHAAFRLDPDVDITIGRDLIQLGHGLTLATPLDHVALRTNIRDFRLLTLAGKTVGSSPDIDLSRTTTRTRRNFLGGELRYTGWDRHEAFAYALWQRDRNREAFRNPRQEFDYDSFYFGVGANGQVLGDLRYASELVYETGHSFGDRRFRRDNDIEAWAFLGELEYLFRGPRQARASIEYLFGSGDSDRTFSPTNSVGGNRNDFLDNSFVAFGYRDTGVAFAPRYSNLHMWRGGGSFYPWPGHKHFGRLELGSNGYLYYKHHRNGGVSDPTADRQSGYLGCELDGFVNWQIDPDLAWTARGGLFFPGPAFSDRTTRPFLLIGMTWSF